MLALLMIITLITIIYKMLLYSPSTVRHCSCDCDVVVVLNMKRIFIITTSLPLLQWVSSSITITFLLRKRGCLLQWILQSQPNALCHNCRSNPWYIWTKHRERKHPTEAERTNQTETRRLTPPPTSSRGKVLSGNNQSNDRPYVSRRAYFPYVRQNIFCFGYIKEQSG